MSEAKNTIVKYSNLFVSLPYSIELLMPKKIAMAMPVPIPIKIFILLIDILLLLSCASILSE